MKKVIIIHGCPSKEEGQMNEESRSYDKHWMPWIEKELTRKEIKVERPLMPDPWEPTYEKFKKEFEKCDVDENTILIGHSCGCAFLVRWLGETKKKVAKLILVAPWKIPQSDRNGADEDFYNYEIDKSLKDGVGEIIMFTSNNEEDDGKKSLEIYHNALGGKIINLDNHGHYTFNGMGTAEFPELLEVILGQKYD